MQKQLLIIIIHCTFLITNCSLAGAQSKIDSLKNELKIANDTNKVIILNNLAEEYSEVNTDTAMRYAHEGLDMSREIGFELEIARSFQLIGIIYKMQAKYIEAFFKHFP